MGPNCSPLPPKTQSFILKGCNEAGYGKEIPATLSTACSGRMVLLLNNILLGKEALDV